MSGSMFIYAMVDLPLDLIMPSSSSSRRRNKLVCSIGSNDLLHILSCSSWLEEGILIHRWYDGSEKTKVKKKRRIRRISTTVRRSIVHLHGCCLELIPEMSFRPWLVGVVGEERNKEKEEAQNWKSAGDFFIASAKKIIINQSKRAFNSSRSLEIPDDALFCKKGLLLYSQRQLNTIKDTIRKAI
jgi:hypothetical protein